MQGTNIIFIETIAILNPSPALPKRFSFGILQSSNMRLQVDDALMPSLSSRFPKLNPGMGFGTIKALIPLCLSDLSVVANITLHVDSYPFVILVN